MLKEVPFKYYQALACDIKLAISTESRNVKVAATLVAPYQVKK